MATIAESGGTCKETVLEELELGGPFLEHECSIDPGHAGYHICVVRHNEKRCTAKWKENV